MAVREIALEIQSGTADPGAVRDLLTAFGNGVSDSQVDAEIVSFLREGFSRYAAGEGSLESCLGLRRKKGRPGASEQMQVEIALHVLELRLAGEKQIDAVADAAIGFGKERTAVEDAWHNRKESALLAMRLGRAAAGAPWTPKEAAALRSIFKRSVLDPEK